MKKVPLLLFLLVLFFAVGWWLSSWSEKRDATKRAQTIAGTQKTLDVFVPILEKFKKEKGGYPSSLKALIPVYVNSLPKAPKDYCYEGSKKNYNLYFVSFDNGLGQNVRFYSPKNNKWLEMDALDWSREIMEKAEVVKAN